MPPPLPASVQLDDIINDPEQWSFFRDGIEVHWLYRGESNASSAALLKYQPGAKAPFHSHPGYEHIYVLQGSQSDEYGEHTKGSLTINPPGSMHSVSSPQGCIVYAVWEKPPSFKV